MSDPVTNVEIEDVLSSIRRLVSDGDKARTRDPAPEHVRVTSADETSETPAESTPQPTASDRLVLTPAFLVPDTEAATVAEADVSDEEAIDSSGDETWEEESWPEPDAEAADATSDADDFDAVDNSAAQDPLPLTDMVFEEIDDVPPAADIAQAPTDRAGLVATIAELEAAISAGDDEFEPDGSEVVAETIAWPGTVVRAASQIADAEISDGAVEEPEVEEPQTDKPEVDESEAPDAIAADDAIEVDDADIMPSFEHRIDDSATTPNAEQAEAYEDDDLDGLLVEGAAGMSQDALRALVAEVVREELAGSMGERITRNVRKLVRREIYRILSSQEFD